MRELGPGMTLEPRAARPVLCFSAVIPGPGRRDAPAAQESRIRGSGFPAHARCARIGAGMTEKYRTYNEIQTGPLPEAAPSGTPVSTISRLSRDSQPDAVRLRAKCIQATA